MRRFNYTLTAIAAFACLWGARAHSQAGEAIEPHKSEVHKPQGNEKAIHDLAVKEGISDEEARQKIDAYKKESQSVDLGGTSHKTGGLILEQKHAFEPKHARAEKVHLTGNGTTAGHPAPNGEKPPANKSAPGIPPEHQSLGDRKIVAKEKNAEPMSEHSEKPEAHHHHQHQQQQSPDPCDRVGSPTEVEQCKKAREEVKGHKQKISRVFSGMPLESARTTCVPSAVTC